MLSVGAARRASALPLAAPAARRDLRIRRASRLDDRQNDLAGGWTGLAPRVRAMAGFAPWTASVAERTQRRKSGRRTDGGATLTVNGGAFAHCIAGSPAARSFLEETAAALNLSTRLSIGLTSAADGVDVVIM